MSLDNTLIDEFAYTFEEEFENDCVKPFPQTVHTDVPLPGSGELLFPQDVIAMSQIVSNPPFDRDLAKNMLPNSTGPSQSPSTDEGVSSSHEAHGYEDPFISQASVSKQTSNIRACFEKVLQEESQSSESSPGTQQSPNYLYLERDPAELKKSSMPVLFNSYDGFQIDAPLSFHSSDAMMNSDLVNSPESYEFVLPEEPLNMPLPRSQPISFIGFTPDMFKVDFLQEAEQKQPNNNRQSKYKNSYSLAEEQAQRYLKDWLSLTETNMKKIQEEERISVQARIEEARKLESVIKIYDSIDQESNNFKNKIKLAEDAKKKGNDPKAELAALVRDRDVLLAARKGYQQNLIEKLKYRRFSLTPSLSKLVNDSPNAFMKREELARYLKEYPKFRTLKCMKSFFEENMKFGLLVSRITVDFLSTKSDPTMISNSTIELKYWLIKSPMENKNKKLFTDEHSRNHIRNELNKIYLELEEKAKTKLAESDMKLFHEVFNGQQGVMNLEFGSENNFSEDQVAQDSGKRAIEFVPSSKEKGAKKTKKN